MLTLSLNSEAMNANGRMNPCHIPSQKPAAAPPGPVVFLKRLGPAVQPTTKQRANARESPKTAISGFFTIPPGDWCIGHLHLNRPFFVIPRFAAKLLYFVTGRDRCG